MAKIKPYKISKKERQQIIGEFFDVVVKLKTKKEVIDFFVGTMTPSEALMFARRMQIAKLILKEGTYDSIRKELGVGYSTINQVDKWLLKRDESYRKVLEKYLPNDLNRKRKNPAHEGIKKKLDRYPGHKLAKQLLGLDYFD